MKPAILPFPVSCHQAALAEYERLLIGTLHFSGVLHHIVDTETNLCIATIGPGPMGAENAMLIARALQGYFHKTDIAIGKARAVAADKERLCAERTRLLIHTGTMLQRLVDDPTNPDVLDAARKMLEPTR